MDFDRNGSASCPSTGLTVPECSCRHCLEEMLHRFRPELLCEDIQVIRTSDQGSERPNLGRDRLG